MKYFLERSKKLIIVCCIIFCIFILFISNNNHRDLIIESDQLSAVLNYIDPVDLIGTLVIFDIDNTLAHPTEELGSDEWFCYMVDKKVAAGFDYLTSVYYTLPKAFYAQFYIPMGPTQPGIPELIADLITKDVAVMALSTRSIFIAERTLEQLDKINMTFFIPGVNPDDLVLCPMDHPCFYKRGILFGGNNDKGKALTCFFKMVNYHPKKIIFVDDKMKHLISVRKASRMRHIPFVGIRYSRCDEKVKNFNPATSEAQWQELKEQNGWVMSN